MADFEKDYWWHSGKWYLIKRLIWKYFPGRTDLNILEIGCGTGEITKNLEAYGKVVGLDISPEALEICRANGVTNVVLGDINSVDLLAYHEKFDLVLALDVLEHIQDDVLAMKRVKDMLKKDGLFFINVPAHKFLWSEHDEALHHKRRYHSFELLSKLKDAGYKVLKKSFFVSAVFPVIVLFRAWNNFFGRSAYPRTSYVILSKPLNDLMKNVLKVEARLVENFSLPIGVTITVVAQNL